VQRLSLIGKGMPKIASGTELLPDDRSPHSQVWRYVIYVILLGTHVDSLASIGSHPRVDS